MTSQKHFPFGFNVPPGRIKHARALGHSKQLRKLLRMAPMIVALWPDGTQELLFGGDYLTHQKALGHTQFRGLFLRVANEEEISYLVAVIVREKNCTNEQWELMEAGTDSRPQWPERAP